MKTRNAFRPHSVPVFAVLGIAFLLSSCANAPAADPSASPPATLPTSATVGPEPSPGIVSPIPTGADASLRIVVKATPEAAEKSSTLVCNGVEPLNGSSVPNPAEACAALQKSGAAVFWPTVPDRSCTMQFGGPQTAQVTGTFRGKPVDKTFSLRDGCAISDWNALSAVLGSSAENGL